MLLMISQKFYYKNHVEFVEPISSALPALIFKAYIGTNVGTRVIPQFSIAASKRVKTVEVSETKPSHPQCRYPFDSRGYGHEQHGDFQPSNIYYEERTNVVTFIDATDSGLFFCCSHTKCLKCGGPLCFGYLIDLLKKSQWVEISQANLISIVFSNTRRFLFGVAFRKEYWKFFEENWKHQAREVHVLEIPQLGFKKRWVEYIWMFPKIVGFPPKIIHFNRVFHYKPSILGYPYFWKHPFCPDEWMVNDNVFFVLCAIPFDPLSSILWIINFTPKKNPSIFFQSDLPTGISQCDRISKQWKTGWRSY